MRDRDEINEAEEDDDWENPDPSDMDNDAEGDADEIDCPYCGLWVSEFAQICPHCKTYISKEDAPRRSARKPLWWIVIVALFVAIFAGMLGMLLR